MRLVVALALVALTACGGGDDPSAESVVRAWSQAVNADDNAAAARLFADGARVVQDGDVRVFGSFAEAQMWNAALPCSGRIVALRSNGNAVRATFVLGHRVRARCDGPGARVSTLFHVEEGKIVLWHQLEPGLQPDDESV